MTARYRFPKRLLTDMEKGLFLTLDFVFCKAGCPVCSHIQELRQQIFFDEYSVENSTACITEKASGTHSLAIVLAQTHVSVRGCFFS